MGDVDRFGLVDAIKKFDMALGAMTEPDLDSAGETSEEKFAVAYCLLVLEIRELPPYVPVLFGTVGRSHLEHIRDVSYCLATRLREDDVGEEGITNGSARHVGQVAEALREMAWRIGYAEAGKKMRPGCSVL